MFVEKEIKLLPRKIQEEILERIMSLLPQDAKIMILSHTGSRVFGWGSERYDIDVRGVIKCGDYWDTFHDGFKWDINLESFKHFLRGVKYRYWTIFQDLSNPFYLAPEFDFPEYMSLCSAANVKNHLYTTRMQVEKARVSQGIRAALHAYELLLPPIHFLRTGEMQVNVRVVNKLYPTKFIEPFADAYAERKSIDIDWDEVMEELDHLRVVLNDELKDREDDLDIEKFEKWRDKITNHITVTNVTRRE